MKIIVLGVGNIILSDEGVGVRAVEEIERRYRFPDYVELIDGGTSGMEVMGNLSHADHVLILDAVNTGAAPGTVVKLSGAEVPKFFSMKMSPHQVTLSDVLATLEFAGESPGSVTVIGVVPVSLDNSLDLTPQVAACLPQLVALALDELRTWGVTVEERS
ncbi:MAG: HyaD/HybD family hydrogenase maturation endopeptidase [Sulfuricella sp.]|nr:HyaD/HybD family hydrogenase maturation endopeptidase [Sulfuricella sp.]